MKVGLVCYWFNRGQAVVGRHLRAALHELGVETAVLARPTTPSFTRPGFVDETGVWSQPGVTRASAYRIPRDEYLDWARRESLDVVLFDQNLQFDEIAVLRSAGYRTIGRFVWESFGPDDLEGARRAFDVIYSMTAAEQRRYRDWGIESPRVRWTCPPEIAGRERITRGDDLVRFLYPGGYLSDRKPSEETLEAFVRVSDPRARLVVKAQHPVRGSQLVERARELDSRIEVIVQDLDTDAHHDLLASADVFLSPTRWEGLGLHHYEALALGLPTITNDFAPMNELVTHDVDGWLIPARWEVERRPGVPRLLTDPEELAAGIESLCDDDRRRRLADAASARGRTLDWSLTVSDVASLLGLTGSGDGTCR